MNEVIIFLVPTGASLRDFEAALRKYVPSLGIPETEVQSKPADCAGQSTEGAPLWTWFLPNPCP